MRALKYEHEYAGGGLCLLRNKGFSSPSFTRGDVFVVLVKHSQLGREWEGTKKTTLLRRNIFRI